MNDSRFIENDQCLEWLQKWQREVQSRVDLKASERNKLFLSTKTMHDVTSCIVGFKALCSLSFQKHPGCNVLAFRVNSDLVENVFCQQRGRNGQNDNPTYAQYGPTINSILLGQTTTTKKSNTGKVDSYAFLRPEKLPVIRKESHEKELKKLKENNKSQVSDRTVALPQVTEFLFPPQVSQSTLGGRNGSNACTLIALNICKYFELNDLPKI